MEEDLGCEALDERSAGGLDTPPLLLPLVLAVVAALLGAAVWGLVAIYADMQYGVIAWGIGGLVGSALVKGGGYGKRQAIIAALLAAMSIGLGRYIIYEKFCWDRTASVMEEKDGHLDLWRQEAEAWRALGEDPTDEEVERFAIQHDYDVEDAADFRQSHAPRLLSWFTDKPTSSADLSAEERGQARVLMWSLMHRTFPFTQYLMQGLSVLDFLFAGLGLATAFGIVKRRTVELEAAACVAVA